MIMITNKIQNHPSYIYATQIVNDEIKPPELYYERNGEKKFISPKYVKKQCQTFLNIADGKDEKYIINENRVGKIDKILKILKMAKGLKVGERIYNSLAGYQWLLIVASLCTVYREDRKRRRYETVILEICRKNGKTFIVALLMLLLFYLEPKYSRFFSVAPDGTLAKEIKVALDLLIKANEDIFEEKEFKQLSTEYNLLKEKVEEIFIADYDRAKTSWSLNFNTNIVTVVEND